MTLVVARVSGDLLRIECDTQITDKNAIRRGATYGALKAIILHRTLCVAYAGIAGRGQVAIRSLNVRPDQAPNVEAILQELLQWHCNGNGETDFLVTAMLGTWRLFRITKGKIEHDLPATWIGTSQGFEVYQRHFHSMQIASQTGMPAFYADAIRMAQAFAAVINDGTCPAVNGYQLSVTILDGQLRYAPAAQAYTIMQQIPSGVPTPLRFGSAAEGGFAYSVMVPKQGGIGAVGIHFHQGAFGALFYPQKAEEAIIFSNANAEEFKRSVFDQFRIELSGSMLG